MRVFEIIGRGTRLVFTSLNVLCGVVVGSLFGAIASVLVIVGLGSEFSFSGNSLWQLLPGMVLGAFAGVKVWPLMLGIFLGGDGGVDDTSIDVQVTESTQSTTPPPESGGASSDERKERSGKS